MTNKNIAITIGVQEYHSFTPLKYAANDAKKMRDFLLNEGGFDEVFYFLDDSPEINRASTSPTGSNLKDLLEKEVKKLPLKTGDNLWFFFAGHGRRENNIDYLIPIDGDLNVETSGISVDYIIQQLQNSGADNIVLILDACRDKVDGVRGGEGVGRQTEQEAREKGIITIFSCSPNELSWEFKELEQGVFTYALLEGLRSKGQKATPKKLNDYLKSRVQQLVQKLVQKKGIQQTPRIIPNPIEKSDLILMPKYAPKSDVSLLKKTNKTRRQILILGGLAGSGFAVAAISGYFRNHTSTENIPSSELEMLPQPKITTDKFTTPKVNRKGEIISRSEGEAEVMIENLGNGVTLEMVKIPGGRFLMGSPETEAQRDDSKSEPHYVDVPEFWMGKYVVTQQQWQEIMGSNPSYFKGKNRPVERVTWNKATKFCQKLSEKTGRDYRLPSEAEWEYACRAGTITPFYFGETITGKLANYKASQTYADEAKGKDRGKTTPVGQFPPNAFGLYDMHGNVREWCEDVWHNSYNRAPDDGSAWVNGGDSSRRVARGGSWYSDPRWCRSAIRFSSYSVETVNEHIGFRLVSFPPRTPE